MSYLVKSPYGIYYFRWSIHNGTKYQQAKVSLRTHCKLTATKEACTLALELQANPPSTIQQLRQFIKSKFAVVIKPTEFISLTMDQLMPLLSELCNFS